MKNFSKFVMRKLKSLMDEMLYLLIIILLAALFLCILALPGVIIAFLAYGFNLDALGRGGLLSVLAIGLVWILIDKVKKIINEYKSFNEEEC